MSLKVNNWSLLFNEIASSIIGGGSITIAQARLLLDAPRESVGELAEAASDVRRHFHKDAIDLCSIINARSGRCSEDCKFCSQSSRHETEVPVFPMKTVNEIVDAAKTAETNEARRFCIVTSGESLNDRDFEVVLTAVSRIKTKTGLMRCASIGRLTAERARALKDAGLNRYHHNIETARGFFPQICTTHTYEDKLATISHLSAAGIESCVGGILNLGESQEQRIEFAFELRALEPVSVPINFLMPRPGTPLADRPAMQAWEAVKYLAIFRFILPDAFIRLAGGRMETFKGDRRLPFASGANALLIGDLLTTKGPDIDADLEALSSLGFDVRKSDAGTD